jgi:bifunctional UDP-N-acetylglucosamine pyrophosphorylase/glucosamine-1-phosphate N-acetyltransferase
VLAAGKGTRMKSALPKVMHEICARPMLWYTLRALREAGVDDIVVVTNREVEPALAAFGVRGVLQEPQRGTGHAVQVGLAALEESDGNIVVAYGDMPLIDAQTFRGVIAAIDDGAALALVTAHMPLPSNFGRIVRSEGGVAKIVEARDCTRGELALDEMNAGIYAYDEAKLRAVIGELRDDNAQKELYLTDTVELLLGRGEGVVPVVAADHRLVLGINDRVELAAARSILNARLCETHMRAGVTIVDPATTYLEPDLIIGADTTIFPNTTIGGETTIGAGARIGPNTRIAWSQIAENVRITESVVTETTVGARAAIGPFAHLRAGTDVGTGVHIGNFVELKKTTMRAGAKAGHLAYLGDATVGERANIGAGTITCNYDGKNKHRTQIGADAFIGSNTSLVAPVSVGDHGMTGAGAVVIRDVAGGERVVGNPARALPPKA